jgi:hypothetical protein
VSPEAAVAQNPAAASLGLDRDTPSEDIVVQVAVLIALSRKAFGHGHGVVDRLD